MASLGSSSFTNPHAPDAGETTGHCGPHEQAHDQADPVGQTLQLAATVYPENATNKAVKWTSDDPEVASVDENGLVTVHKKNGMRKVII